MTAPVDPELLLHRAAQWRRQFVAGHGIGYDDDPTFRLVRDLADALKAAGKVVNPSDGHDFEPQDGMMCAICGGHMFEHERE